MSEPVHFRGGKANYPPILDEPPKYIEGIVFGVGYGEEGPNGNGCITDLMRIAIHSLTVDDGLPPEPTNEAEWDEDTQYRDDDAIEVRGILETCLNALEGLDTTVRETY
jgi:hypothetical protein